MSAYIVSKKHIDTLVSAALMGQTFRWCVRNGVDGSLEARELTYGNASEVGVMLWAENHASVNARYGEEYPCPPYTFKRETTVGRYDPVALLKAVACYEYQSCEHDAWEHSDAKAFCDALRHHLIHHLPGYSAAPWGVYEDESSNTSVDPSKRAAEIVSALRDAKKND